MCTGVLAQVRPKKAPVKQEFRPLTQEELLAEAAQTEIENTASVQVSGHSLGLHAHVIKQSGLLSQSPGSHHLAGHALQLSVQLQQSM